MLQVSADELLGLSAVSDSSSAESSSITSKASGLIYPASVTLEDYLLTLLNTIARQKKQMDQTVRNLHSCGIPTTTIARVTAIHEDEIQKLLDQA